MRRLDWMVFVGVMILAAPGVFAQAPVPVPRQGRGGAQAQVPGPAPADPRTQVPGPVPVLVQPQEPDTVQPVQVPVPIPGPVPASPTTPGDTGSPVPDFSVIEWAVDSQLLLEDRLKVKAEDGFELMQILPVEAGKSLFFFSPGAGASYAFVSAPSLSSALVDAEIRRRSGQRFLGAHRLTSGSNLLLFRAMERTEP